MWFLIIEIVATYRVNFCCYVKLSSTSCLRPLHFLQRDNKLSLSSDLVDRDHSHQPTHCNPEYYARMSEVNCTLDFKDPWQFSKIKGELKEFFEKYGTIEELVGQ